MAHRCPVRVIGRDDRVLRKLEDALLEYQLRVGGTHDELRLASVAELLKMGSKRWTALVVFVTFAFRVF